MKKTKQILSVFLSVCMIISCMVGMSVTASATSLTMNDLVTAVGTSTFNWSGYKVQVVEGKLMYVTPWNSEEARDLTYNSSDGKYHLKFGIFDNDWYIVIDSDNYITSFMGDNGGTYESYSGKSQYALNLSAPTTPATTTGGFVKVTDKSQITEDNIGESTAAEAKAWIIANLTTLQSEQGTWYDFFFKENGTVKLVILNYTRLDEAHVNDENVYAPEDFSIASYYFSSNENVYFWGGSSTPATTYSITMPNGGTAYVDQQQVTSAAAGADVTIVAPQAEPGTQFNGWTTTTAGVAFTDATASTTHFTMPESDVTINASFENIAYNITMPNGGTAYVNQQEVTEAEEGAIVTIVAPDAEPGTEFNGWTSTPEVSFADAEASTTSFEMPASDVTISASFQNIAYNITMLNGGTAYVDGEPATTAEAGTVVTIKAKSSVSTPAKFNGWTTTTEGVEFADADSVETTFVMPISDVTITASFEGVTPYVPSYSTGTSTTTSSGTASSVDSASSKAKMWAVQNDDKSSITVGWEKVNGATKYSLYVRKNGKLEKVVDTKKTKVRINNPENNTTLEYVLKYTIGGVESGENSAYTASIKVYYKPAVKATSKNGAVILKWNKVEGAEKYRVYKYTGGKLVKVADTEANAVRLKNVTEGKTYKYAVKAYVDGKWTKVTKSDIVSVKVK